MNLKEQLQKIIDDQEKLERKKDKFLEEYDEKRKKILLKKNSEEFSLKMEIASENNEEKNTESEMNVPNFGTQQSTENIPYSFNGNES